MQMMNVDITDIPFPMKLGTDFYNELAEEILKGNVNTLYSFEYKHGLQNLAIFAKNGCYKNRIEIVIKTIFASEINIFLKIFLDGEQALYVKIVDPNEHQALRTAFLNGTEKRIESAKNTITRILSAK